VRRRQLGKSTTCQVASMVVRQDLTRYVTVWPVTSDCQGSHLYIVTSSHEPTSGRVILKDSRDPEELT